MMSIISKFIQRPVLTTAFCAFILILGLFGFSKMPLRYLPKMEQAKIEVTAFYPGANAEVVKSFVTSKIQSTLVGVEGVDYIKSESANENSTVDVSLLPGVNVDAALTDVAAKVGSVQGDLPSAVLPPQVAKRSMDDQPFMILGVSSQKENPTKVADYLRRVVEPQIESIDGVSLALVWGGVYAMQVWLNPDKLNAYHLVPQDIVDALNAQNVLAAPGKTQGNYFNYNLNVTTALHTTDEFNNLVIKVVNHVPIYLKDVGEARPGGKDDNYQVYFNDKPTTMIGVYPSPGSNPLTVAREILQKMPQLGKSLASDLSLHVVLNQTDFIKDSIHEVVKTLVESILIVIIVMYLFLGNLRAALIPTATIPLSLLGICFFMYLGGYSINTISLLAMVLAVGLVVDDAIVVVENIVRHLKGRMAAIPATLQAMQELISPIIAMTITLTAVFIPISFTGGLIGQLFNEFAFALAGSVLLSGVVALTLSPMMCARLLNEAQQEQPLALRAERVLVICQNSYKRVLTWILARKKVAIWIWLAIIGGTIALYMTTPSELMPSEDQGFLIASGDAPAAANIAYLDHYGKMTMPIFKTFPEIGQYAMVLSPDEGGYMAYLIARDEGGKKVALKPIIPALQKKLDTIPGLDIHVIAPNILGGSGPSVRVVILSTADYSVLYQLAQTLAEQGMATGNFMYLYNDLTFNQPQATINIDTAAAAAADVPMNHIADALTTLMSHRQVQQFSTQGQSYDVVIKMLPQYQLNPEDLQNIPIATSTGATVPLASVASIKYTIVPPSLPQFQRMNSVTIMGALMPGHTLSQGLSALQKIAQVELPKSTSLDYAGQSRQFMQEGHRMILIFGLALMVIFLVLSMQFESYRDSLIILLGSVPLALFAALIPLKFGLGSINIYTQIGLLTLVGLISKHGILITRFANEIRQKDPKISKDAAVIDAALLRFRPILMTTAAIFFGAIPLMLASGAGSGSRHAIGMVIGFGISIGTVLTLLLLPVIYTYVAKGRVGS